MIRTRSVSPIVCDFFSKKKVRLFCRIKKKTSIKMFSSAKRTRYRCRIRRLGSMNWQIIRRRRSSTLIAFTTFGFHRFLNVISNKNRKRLSCDPIVVSELCGSRAMIFLPTINRFSAHTRARTSLLILRWRWRRCVRVFALNMRHKVRVYYHGCSAGTWLSRKTYVQFGKRLMLDGREM